jgi:lipoyl(octanoyl) transferase
MSAPLHTHWLGRVSFADALALQEEIVYRKHERPETPDELLLLEHDPVYTIGRTPDRSSLRGANHLPHPLFQINRGGQATYHGPGQLVGYFLLDLRRYGIDATTRAGLTGVWVGERKIASIGVGVRHWITMHGFALNVGGDLSPFDAITPCGIADVAMTSIEMETGAYRPPQRIASEGAEVAQRRIADLSRSASRSTRMPVAI